MKKIQQQDSSSSLSQDQIPVIGKGTIVADKYTIIDQIGSGSFGTIFRAQKIENNFPFAIKFEQRQESGVQILVREIRTLIDLKEEKGFPKIEFYGRDEYYNYYLMTYLKSNLEELLKICGGKFQIETILQIFFQVIERLQVLHIKKFIHRDIKPENFMVQSFDSNLIYLVDFGLSKNFRDSQGYHIPFITNKGLVGTARYASLNAHRGNEQGRRDDIESTVYMMIYFAKGLLPWMNLNIDKKEDKYKKITEIKAKITAEELCSNLPLCFTKIFNYSKELSFEQEPNYEKIKYWIQQDWKLISNKCQHFDWNKDKGDAYSILPNLIVKENEINEEFKKEKLKKQVSITIKKIKQNIPNESDDKSQASKINNYEIDSVIEEEDSLPQYNQQILSQNGLVKPSLESMRNVSSNGSSTPFITKFNSFKQINFNNLEKERGDNIVESSSDCEEEDTHSIKLLNFSAKFLVKQ